MPNGNGKGKPVSDIPDPKIRRLIADKCEQIRVLADEVKALETARKELLAEVAEVAKANRLYKVVGDSWLLLKSKGSRTNISAERLVEKGVPVDVIEYATVKKEWASWQVRNR